MSAPSNHASPPAWEDEADLAQAREQVRRRVAQRSRGPVHWLQRGSAAEDLSAIEGLGDGVVVGSDQVLWDWTRADLEALSRLIRERGGWLVFVEPTAGLGWRRLAQVAADRLPRRRGVSYRVDVPAELRAAGFVVTTQVRFRSGTVGDHVRGEAHHYPQFDREI